MNVTEALRRRAFSSVFQPIVRLSDGVVVGYEALTRFHDGSRPDLRFAEAHAAGCGPALEYLTMASAVRAARDLPSGLWLSTNLSPTLLILHPHKLRRLATRSGRRMIFEVVESFPVEDVAQFAAARQLTGVELAVDDVGAGYADAERVTSLRPELVKLDRALVADLASEQALIETLDRIVDAARAVGAVVLGEGVETEPQRQVLLRHGAELGQGWLFGRPMRSDDLAGAQAEHLFDGQTQSR